MTHASMQLDSYLQSLNHFRRRLNVALFAIYLLRSLCLALTITLLWAWIRPEAWEQQLFLFLLSLVAFVFMSWKPSLKPGSRTDCLLALEIAHPELAKSPYKLMEQTRADPAFQAVLDQELQQQKDEGRQWFFSKASSLVLPLLSVFLLSSVAGQALENSKNSLRRLVLSLSHGSTLQILEGSGQQESAALSLGHRTLELEVLEQNLIEVQVIAAPKSAPLLQLKNKQGKITQTFQLLSESDESDADLIGRYKIRFNLSEESELYLSSISSSRATAHILVKKLPVPEVLLSSFIEPDTLWPDDKPLPLRITVKAKNPLQSIHLLIKSGERTHRELISEIMVEEKFDFETTYSLPLENYVEQDLQDLEIVGEAVDKASPRPLVGHSPPIIIKVASAYGRYRKALQTLQEAKKELDAGMEGNDAFNPKALLEHGEQAILEAEDSPFFDGLDRQQIQMFQQQFKIIAAKKDMQAMLESSEDLNRFLFEHESLDDRERDRDFFIAARTLSRVLEQSQSERLLPPIKVVEQLHKFLDERQKRWELRVQRLDAEHQPTSWATVQQKPFQKSIDKLANLGAPVPPQELQALSKTVDSYRQWIEELESKEDQFRQQQEQSRQQGLANAQNQLRELQKRQAQISSKLDRAAEQSPEQLQSNWASVRMDQNSNIQGAGSLEAQMRALSPGASQRMKAAQAAMEKTAEQGNLQNFEGSESASDMAGRLLQQAESAARRSQQDQSKRGRRRRVTSDQYYGNQVTGGDVDLKRDYQVQRRYREDVLEDVRETKRRQGSEENDSLLEDYLRKVVR